MQYMPYHTVRLAVAEHTLSEQLDVERDHQRVLIPINMAEGASAFREQRDPEFDNPQN